MSVAIHGYLPLRAGAILFDYAVYLLDDATS